MALETARNLEARLGRKTKGPLMPANEIIRMDADEALMLHGNALPVKLNTHRYFEQRRLNARAAIPPAPLPHAPHHQPSLIPL